MLAVGIILRGGNRGLMISAFFLILIISTALLFGNEFSVGFFIHPSLTRADHRAFLPAIQVFARFFGKIMPIWMTGTLLFHLLLLCSFPSGPFHLVVES